MTQTSHYVIATIRPWNLIDYQKYFERNKNFTLIPAKKDLQLEKLKKINPRYIFFPHWSWIIPKEVWHHFDCVVFHMTDLPYGRGGSPLQNLILKGLTKTKISAIKVDAGMDTGKVYLKHPLSLNGNAEQIYKRMSRIIFTEMIPYMIKNQPTPIIQSGKTTFFIRRTPKQSEIKSVNSLTELYDFIRMLDAPEYPKAFITKDQFRIEFSRARLKKGILSAKVNIYET